MKKPPLPAIPRETASLPAPGRLPPSFRELQIFSFDPSAALELETARISRCTIPVRWEDLGLEEGLPGPAGEYLEIVDVDPASDCAYDPVDLDDPYLLAQDGLSPSAGNPQFHQQMVYAVAMTTIANFEQALGRPILWSERQQDERGRCLRNAAERYVRRLRIYPHALREENAYYSPDKKSLLFGYFDAPTTDPRDELPGGAVFTCLSHDIVAHETTHAILDGLHRRLLEAANPDMLAFHEAFADIVAIFQHFTLPGVLLDQIERSRGDLRTDTLLVRLASQFARATGRGGALRNALGEIGPDGRPAPPDPAALARASEPHERGAIFVAAVFDAFLQIYEQRVADLRRIASGGTGILPQGDVHPDLARRFAGEAVSASRHVLNICIRALDYLPPVDVTFGDYLRALVTADADFYPDDPDRYRVAFIDAFRDRGIYPLDVRALGEDSLHWQSLDRDAWEVIRRLLPPAAVLQTMTHAYDCDNQLEELHDPFQTLGRARPGQELFDRVAQDLLQSCWFATDAQPGAAASSPLGKRFARYRAEQAFARLLHFWIVGKALALRKDAQALQTAHDELGIDFQAVLSRNGGQGGSGLEVHAVRPTTRIRFDGRTRTELLVILTQSATRTLCDEAGVPLCGPDGQPLTFKTRGGCTLIIDPESASIRYAIRKTADSPERLARQQRFLRDRLEAIGSSAIGRHGLAPANPKASAAFVGSPLLEPFAAVHRGNHQGED